MPPDLGTFKKNAILDALFSRDLWKILPGHGYKATSLRLAGLGVYVAPISLPPLEPSSLGDLLVVTKTVTVATGNSTRTCAFNGVSEHWLHVQP